jgi:hypothetical protein
MARMIAFCLLLVLAGPAAAGSAASEPSGAAPPEAAPPSAAPVTVERVRPVKDKKPTLRFLRENLDFLRGRLDALRAEPGAGPESGQVVDPRTLLYRELVAALQADRAATDAEARRLAEQEFLDSIAGLAELERQLDVLETALTVQGDRLHRLETDFVGHQETALRVLVRGMPAANPPDRVSLADETGRITSLTLDAGGTEALARGGVAELCHALVEPMSQTFEVTVSGPGWTEPYRGWITLAPERDAVTCVLLDLTDNSAWTWTR